MSNRFGPVAKLAVSVSIALLLVQARAGSAAPAGRYEIRADRSLVSILVYRGGFLQPFGHNHVISSRELGGTVQWRGPGRRSGHFSIELPLDSLVVDRAEDRAAQGKDFARDVDEGAGKATRRNLLGPRVLDYPRFRLIKASGEFDDQTVHAEIDLHGVKRNVAVPVRITSAGDVLSADGGFAVRQSDFNIEPFRAVSGLLRVRDRIEIRFHIVARLTGR
jgi:polyisoprenoid-binding protein YceI